MKRVNKDGQLEQIISLVKEINRKFSGDVSSMREEFKNQLEEMKQEVREHSG